MIVEEPVDAEKVQEEEREDHDFLCDKYGYQDDTDLQFYPMCHAIAALDEQKAEYKEESCSDG